MSARIEPKEFAGKVALVTGASKGIGAGIATAFAAAGASVAIGYARDGAERVASGINASGGKAIGVQGDLTKTDDAKVTVAQTVAAFGPIDILVNNAAVFDFKALSDIDEAHVRHILDANVARPAVGHQIRRRAIQLCWRGHHQH
jgi:3-oxoacyl-[acyl-carrier protein] reductase